MKKILKTYWLVILINLLAFSFLVIYLDISVIKKAGMVVIGITSLFIFLIRDLSDKKAKKLFDIKGQQVTIYGIIRTVRLKKDAIISLEVKKTLLARMFDMFRVRIGTVTGSVTVYTRNGDISGLIADLPGTPVASN